MNTAGKIISQLIDEVQALEAEIVKLKKENEQYFRWWLEEKERNKAAKDVIEVADKLAPGEPDCRD